MEWKLALHHVHREVTGYYLGDNLVRYAEHDTPCAHALNFKETGQSEAVALWTIPTALIVTGYDTLELCLDCLNEIAGKEAVNVAAKPGAENNNAIEIGKQ